MSILPHNKFKSSSNPNKVERKFYKVWVAMKSRCSSKEQRDKKWYFDKGVKVCERWQDFNYFFIDMWDSYNLHRELNDSDTELDRIDSNGHYSKINCRWITRLENMNNTRNVRRIKGKTITEWSEILKIKRGTLARRLDQGWSEEEILSHPFGGKSRNKLITS
jgi:hypothetical protein